MRISDESKSLSLLFVSTVNSRDYKLNNYQAFRCMFEIMKNKGRLPFDDILVKYITQSLPGADAPNAKTLSEKLQRFADAWRISSAESKSAIKRIVDVYFDFWLQAENIEHYPDAMRFYSGSKDCPTYLNVEAYLNEILGSGDKMKELTDERNSQYYILAKNWAKDVRQAAKEFFGE